MESIFEPWRREVLNKSFPGVRWNPTNNLLSQPVDNKASMLCNVRTYTYMRVKISEYSWGFTFASLYSPSKAATGMLFGVSSQPPYKYSSEKDASGLQQEDWDQRGLMVRIEPPLTEAQSQWRLALAQCSDNRRKRKRKQYNILSYSHCMYV